MDEEMALALVMMLTNGIDPTQCVGVTVEEEEESLKVTFHMADDKVTQRVAAAPFN